jgi:flagellar motor protein MotB
MLGAVLTCFVAPAQNSSDAQNHRTQPLYRITIVSRTTKAINYGYLTAPTSINFAGTPLLPDARGEATIEPRRGATSVTAHFSNVPPPTRFGPEYLTYVVWAISPEGRAQNLGELVLDASNKGTLKTSVPMQTFAMIVTAEPYYAVNQPSDVVVMENVVGPGTVGKVEEVNATYELLPRKPYTYDPAAKRNSAPDRKPVSKEEYEAIVALYQAQNAIQIAESQQADRYAPERIARARELYNQARGYPSRLSKEIVSLAREATQIAEDSRAIAAKRAAADRPAEEHKRAVENGKPEPPPSAASRPPHDSSGGYAERPLPPRGAPEPATTAESPSPPAPEPRQQSQAPIEVNPSQFKGYSAETTENRKELLMALERYFDTRDTPRGVVVTLRDPLASSAALQSYLNQLAAAIRPYRNIHVAVEANSDRADEVAATQERAEAIRRSLIAAGVPAGIIIARGLGASRPLTANTNAAARARNRRVEIVIAGDPIGRLPTWDRTYNLAPGAGGR